MYKMNDTQDCYTRGYNSYGKERYNGGSVIEMILDFAKRELRYVANGVDQGVAFTNIKQLPYIAVVSTNMIGHSIELLDYSEEYTKGI